MTNLTSTIEKDVQRLRAAIFAGNDEQIDREVPALERNLLHGQGYMTLGDERLLAEALRLLTHCYGPERQQQLAGLRQRLEEVHAIHTKLYAVLNPTVSLDDLLNLHLNTWPQVSGPVECAFDPVVKDQLHAARDKGTSEQQLEAFFDVHFHHLSDMGHDDIVQILQPLVALAQEGYKRIHAWAVQGLFSTALWGEVHGLKIQPHPQGTGQISCANTIDPDMERAAKNAVSCVRRLWSQSRLWDFTWEIGRDDIPFAGNSIGLALTMGLLSKAEGFDVDSYTAFTGHVDWNTGAVTSIDHLESKLQAARELGIRRVLIPRQNLGEATGFGDLDIIPVDAIGDAKEWLQKRSYKHANTPIEQIAAAKISHLDVELSRHGIRRVGLTQPTEFQRQVTYSDRQGAVVVDVYHGQKGIKLVPPPQDTELARRVRAACDLVFGAPTPATAPAAAPSLSTTKPERSKYPVPDRPMQQRIESYIRERDDSIVESENNCVYRAKIVRSGQVVFVRQFTSGTLTVDGPMALFTEVDGAIRAILGLTGGTILEIDTRQTKLNAQIQAVEAVVLGEQWIGTDESGKGDFFGPLVAAAVLVDARTAALLTELGVRDSKNLSDKQNMDLAVQIRQVCGAQAQVVTIPPERYNVLYDQMTREGKNLNTLLAWAHTRALENLLTAFPQNRITVIIDQFADEHYIQDKLLASARNTELHLVQLPKAEANVAVAAASILARAEFLNTLNRLSREYSVTLPKGASDPSIAMIGRQIVARGGRPALAKVAKLHFKTTAKIFG